MKNKQRHGCLTAWLIYLIIAYSFGTIIFFFKTDEISKITLYKTSENLNMIYGSLAILGVVFSVMLLKWVKLGFWGILFISISILIMRIINDLKITSSIYVFLCLLVLFGLLQLKKGNISGWNNLE